MNTIIIEALPHTERQAMASMGTKDIGSDIIKYMFGENVKVIDTDFLGKPEQYQKLLNNNHCFFYSNYMMYCSYINSEKYLLFYTIITNFHF